ncbi:MAG: hypothetical protein Q9191_002859, partial [Dirinaria sp. TL-2023a]
MPEPSTPAADRRSIHFAGPAASTSPAAATGPGSLEDGDFVNRNHYGANFLSKIRALANASGTQSHSRTTSGVSFGGDSVNERSSGAQSATGTEPHQTINRAPDDAGSEVDADAEQSSGEDSSREYPNRKRKRKFRRPFDDGNQTAPTTPKTPSSRNGRPNFFTSNSSVPTERFRPSFLQRRATMTDIPGEARQGVSEDEGRDRMKSGSPWRKGNAWAQASRGLSYKGHKPSQQSVDERRPSNFRRAFTGLGSSGDAPESSPFSSWKFNRSEGAPSVSAAKWRQLKAGLRMIGQRRKAENTVDHAKSAELLAELTAGVPAALLLASMFQRDEHGNRRVPILLEQLKVRVTDSQHADAESKSGDRHLIFRIELEYGSGLTRMKWVIHRALKDFANLHARYKLQISAQKYIQLRNDDARTRLPHFPRSTFPYLRGIRGIPSDSDEDDENEGELTGASGGEASGTERPAKKKKSRPTLSNVRRKLSSVGVPGGDAAGDAGTTLPGKRETYQERQRKKLETYLQQMIRYLIFRPESNRLCKFLELSALGVRLAAEGSYHGKEGLLIIQSGKGVDFRKAWTPSLIKSRHGPKWFAVRHSYIVCVDSPEEMNIYDVFLVDSSFDLQTKKKRIRDQKKPRDMAKTARESASHPQHHSLRISNSERKLKLLAKNERQLHQFEESIRYMSLNSPWAKPNRFDSFAPVRSNVFAQWLVDGRDYMWNVSRAIDMAKDVIHIHDWWLTPELYMRRPAAISQKWRLDRLLQRKAREGVKVFVIVYRNINSAIPIDSTYTKFSLLDLHPNVFVQRSPNQIRQNTFFWAHHEKLCIVDYSVAFVGGIDLCFGRWDTPQHTVVDDKLTGFELSDKPKDADHCQLWPGKDYSNPRVQDFYALDKPYEEMYDRSKVPRMPWHDISMQVVGQPARDLSRHFVQRWNFILRQRKPTRPTPFLLPPPDYNPADLEALGLQGTCEVQILRSCAWWSIGTPDKTEHSIMNAYIKMIEQSEHFVYIENQFFVSSCEVEGTRIENHIGNALVERIIRASQKGESWRAVIVIPLMPGFQNTVDSQDGTSVRLIMQCQFRSICRGDSSIFGKLKAQGIEPEDYIQFYGLRSWGMIGPAKQLVTEQLYIHAKCMVVDDKIAIIGSANINERSMLGSRDSECAAVVRDTDMLWSTMNGEPYLVGRFPHTLRMRLMREHIGVDVDEVMEEERLETEQEKADQFKSDMDGIHGDDAFPRSSTSNRNAEAEIPPWGQDDILESFLHKESLHSFNHDVDWEQKNNPNLYTNKRLTTDPRVSENAEHRKDVKGGGADEMLREEEAGRAGGRDTIQLGDREVLLPSRTRDASRRKSSTPRKSPSPAASDNAGGNESLPPPPPLLRGATAELNLPQLSQLPPLPTTDDTDIGGPPIHHRAGAPNPLVADMQRPFVDKNCMRDPLNDSFFLDTWHAIAENNTKLFRSVFRCMPDNEVKTWKEYKEYSAYAERFSQSQGGGKSKDRVQQDAPGSSGPPGQGVMADKLRLLGPIGEIVGDTEEKAETLGEKILHHLPQNHHNGNKPLGKIEDWAEEANRAQAARQDARTRADTHGRDSPSNHKNGSSAVLNEKASGDPSSSHHSTQITSSDPALRDFAPLKPLPTLDTDAASHHYLQHQQQQQKDSVSPGGTTYSDALSHNASSSALSNNTQQQRQQRRRRATTRSSRKEFHASDDIMSRSDAEELMGLVQGHLVVWPYD